MMNGKENSYISLPVNLPNMFKQAKWRLAYWFPTSINEISSIFAWFLCTIEMELNLFWVTVEHSHALSHLNVENDLSGVADVGAFAKTIPMIKTMFLINLLSLWGNDWITLTTSPRLIVWDSPQITWSSSKSTIRECGS